MKLRFASTLALAACLSALPAFAQDEDAPPPSPRNPSTYNETRMSNLEEQLRVLNGRVEQLDFNLRRLDQSLQRLQSDDDTRLRQLESAQQAAATAAAAAPPATVIENSPVEANGTLGALSMQNGRITGAVVNPKAPPLPNVPDDYGLTPSEQYERAFGLLRAANYDEAEKAFKSFIDKNPKDKLIDNAKYWYGETLYVRARFDEAAVAFADAYQQNPLGTKAPDSLLKLGMSLAAMNKIPDACTTLLELKTKFPHASETIKARNDEERGRLKCPVR